MLWFRHCSIKKHGKICNQSSFMKFHPHVFNRLLACNEGWKCVCNGKRQAKWLKHCRKKLLRNGDALRYLQVVEGLVWGNCELTFSSLMGFLIGIRSTVAHRSGIEVGFSQVNIDYLSNRSAPKSRKDPLSNSGMKTLTSLVKIGPKGSKNRT